jgi:ABC-type antimicrobial peptide transport system permease subunit
MFFEVRTVLPPMGIVSAVRRIVAGLDPNVPVTGFITQTRQIEQTIAPNRVFASLCTALALLAVLLSAIGIFGVMAYTVARRRGEIGIRVALGAKPAEVLWLVWRESLWLAGLGVALGGPAVLATTKLVKSVLYGIEPRDPATIAGAALLLLLVAAFAAWLPARRAARMDPMTVLRCE